jgi:hypothetical protein
MIRRFLSVLLALLLVFIAPAFASGPDANEEEWDDEDFGETEFDEEEDWADFMTISGYDVGDTYECGEYRYRISEDGNSVIIISYLGGKEKVSIPQTLDNLPVEAIGDDAFRDNPVVESVVIPEGVHTIGRSAFKQCARLRSVEIKEGLVELQYGCFGGCAALEEVILPESLEEVDEFAFAACTRLKELTFGPRLKTVGTQAMAYCVDLARVTLPAGNTVIISEDAFDNASADLIVLRQ